ncbi:MAG: serine/threonine protein kinase [Pseudomonadota bacterium]|nr:serine/threonine protein kinase [Pseudomonadota bacterium]
MHSDEPQAGSHPFERLTPDFLLDALDGVGFRGDGRLLALNSYENRVWQVGLEDGGSVVAKFYRPQRWSEAQLREEHAFAADLAAAEVPVVAALADDAGETLHAWQGFHFAVYPRRGGRAPELDRAEVLERMGFFLGRLHTVGAQRRFTARPAISQLEFGQEPRAFLLDSGLLPDELRPSWVAISEQALEGVARLFREAGADGLEAIRLHGDCHPGNVLWTDAGPHFVDLDDARSGPAVQDIWMLLSGARADMEQQLAHVLRGYRAFRRFDARELLLVEALRTLRLIHYCAWIARRWDDPAFPRNFPWFGTPRYWQDRILELREQVALMQEEPLALPDLG